MQKTVFYYMLKGMENQSDYEAKKERLLTLMGNLEAPVVACSGGADSALVTQLAFRLHPQTALAVFASTEAVAKAEREYAAKQAEQQGWRLDFLTLKSFDLAPVRHNERDRCYHCKTLICSAIRNHGKAKGGRNFLEGSNGDDAQSYRPGSRAVTETGFLSPLATVGFSKAEVRRFGAELGLASAGRPSAPCLLTRFPYALPGGVKTADIARIEIGEHHLKQYLRDDFRLRFVDDGTARIEAVATEHDLIRNRFDKICQGIPFARVILDSALFQSGSFDRKAGEGQ